LQRIATEALGDREGAVIVIDPQTGRLRAVVNPRVAFEQTYPPGSAIKPFTALAAMRAGLLDRESRHQCRTQYARGDFEIVCSHPKSNSPFDLPQALAYSCNDYFATVGERLSEGAFNSTLGGFGFGARTGVNANESTGNLPRGDWRVQTALGDSDRLLVTPVQLIAAYAALVNGGRLFRPRQSDDASAISEEAARLNILPAHRDVLIEGMRGAVKYGTAASARLSESPLYIFGKTGTSTASSGFRTQGWFVGFTAEKPAVGASKPEQIKLGVLVFLRRAHGSQCAEVAKPILEGGGTGRRGDRETGRQGDEQSQDSVSPQSSILNPQSIKVRSVRENLTREMSLEEYLVGVVASEASIESELDALKAQAIVSRTYALKNPGRHAKEGYDFCSLTHCQQYLPPKAETRSPYRRAVEETAGETLRDSSGRIADAYFHAACGGVTANLETLWGAPSPPYLRGVRDDFCASMPRRRWTQSIPARQLLRAMRSDERTNTGARLDAVVVSKRDATGRAETITLEGERRRTLRGWDFKMIVGRSLGWQMIKSSRFEVTRAGGDFIFRGGGFGHGLGLCQEGAHVMAQRGMNFRRILQFYFPGTRLKSDAATSFSRPRPEGGASPSYFPGAESPQRQLGDGSSPTYPRRTTIESPQRQLGDGSSPTYPRRTTIESPQRRLGDGSSPTYWEPSSSRNPPDGSRGMIKVRPSALRRLDLNHPPTAVGVIVLLPAMRVNSVRQAQSSEHFRAVFPSDVEPLAIEQVLRILERARTDLVARLESASLRIRENPPFEVVIHGTTAEFIEATGQSGWAAGVTRGRKIELQPLNVLQRRGILASTLRHELAHAFVELLSDGRAPRWLSEGLAIHVAGEGARFHRAEPKLELSREELERRLAKPASAAESRALYAAAWREVRAIIQAEGEAAAWKLAANFKEKRMA
jgi:stage II sporulation protein D